MHTDSVGIVNLHGKVECDANGCLPVCTMCRDKEAPSLPPTPTAAVARTTNIRKRETAGSAVSVFTAVGLFVVCLFGSLSSAVVMRQCRNFKCGRDQPEDEEHEGVEVRSLRSPLMGSLERPDATEQRGSSANDDATATTLNEPRNQAKKELCCVSDDAGTASRNRNETRLVSLRWSAVGSSPAPIFAIDRDMRIVSWSPGAWCYMAS